MLSSVHLPANPRPKGAQSIYRYILKIRFVLTSYLSMIGQGKGCKWRGKSSQYRAGKASLRGASRRAPAAGQIHEELMLGKHCFVMASRRALRGGSRRAPAAG